MKTKTVGSKEYEIKTYDTRTCISFAKVRAPFGGLHNMSSDFPISINNNLIVKSSEHLYQAFRFPHRPDIQKEILDSPRPMGSKFVMKKHIELSRSDWDDVKLPIMKWVLYMKLLNNWETFGSLLLSSEDKTLVEWSREDDFWGAVPNGNQLIGVNALGRLLMGIRSDINGMENNTFSLSTGSLEDMILLGSSIETYTFGPMEKITK